MIVLELKDIAIDTIIIEDRVRKTVGIVELGSLERSIMSLGLLQPIGITPNNKLIFGARRIRACKQLGWKSIPAYVIDTNPDDPSVIIRMERDENERRLEFTPSERIEIGRRIEESLARRWGSNQYLVKELPQNFGEARTAKDKESAAVAAKAVDMNRETYRQAKAVVDSGNQDVIEQMDKGDLSIHAAYKHVRQTEPPLTFKITLKQSPSDDAETILAKAGTDYAVKLAIALLEASGQKVEIN